MPTDERTRRWQLILGKGASSLALSPKDQRLETALELVYTKKPGGTSSAGIHVLEWLEEIRDLFSQSTVRVLQRDAMKHLGLHSLMAEPEILDSLEPDLDLASTLLGFRHLIPTHARSAVEKVIAQVLENLRQKLALRLQEAARGALSSRRKIGKPRFCDVDWKATIRKNLRHWQVHEQVLIPEKLVGRTRQKGTLGRVFLAVDQSGSMIPSVIYSTLIGSVLAQLPSISTQMVLFDTRVVDVTEELQDPVGLLMGAQLGGGTLIGEALGYCRKQIASPLETTLFLVTDLYEGGEADLMLKHLAALVQSGVFVICCLALSEDGRPGFSQENAQRVASLGIPCLACTPDHLPDFLAASLRREDLNLFASQRGLPCIGSSAE